jgi:hypothetical protein
VLDKADRSSSVAASLSIAAELLEGRVDIAAANGVCWGTQSVLVATLSHFLELEAELELLGSTRNANLMEDQLDKLLTQVRPAWDLLVSHVIPSINRSPPDGAGE